MIECFPTKREREILIRAFINCQNLLVFLLGVIKYMKANVCTVTQLHTQ